MSIDATGAPGHILLIGGESEIGRSIVERILAARPGHTLVTTTTRRPTPPADFIDARQTNHEPLDLSDPTAHRLTLERIDRGQPLDLVVIAAGVLGQPEDILEDAPDLALDVLRTNALGASSVLLHAMNLLRSHGLGEIIVVSSVAAVRVRPSNAVYGASKRMVDDLARALRPQAAKDGVTLRVVRPGFVRTRMTTGLSDAPFTQTPAQVADAVFSGRAQGRRVIYAPEALRGVAFVIRHLPVSLLRFLR